METLSPKNHFDPEKRTFEYLAKVTFIGGLATFLLTIIRQTNDVIARNGGSTWAVHFEQLLDVSCVFAVFALFFWIALHHLEVFPKFGRLFQQRIESNKGKAVCYNSNGLELLVLYFSLRRRLLSSGQLVKPLIRFLFTLSAPLYPHSRYYLDQAPL